MRAKAMLTFVMACLAGVGLASAQSKTYSWVEIDCRQSRIVAWQGLKCRSTNVVTSEGNIGVFRQWAVFGTSLDGYFHIFLWDAQNAFSYLTVDDTTVGFVKWMYEHGQFASQFSPLARYHGADYLTFRDEKHGQSCAGFRRLGGPQRGGYEWMMGGIMCAPSGKNLTNDQIDQFIDRVRLQ